MSTLNTTNLKHPSSGSNNIVLDSSGRVGIGTTPGSTLNVVGNEIRFSNSTNASFYGAISHDAVTTGNNFYDVQDTGGHVFRLSGTERMRIANNGAISTVVPGGSTLYPAFDCRAWVNFNGTGTVAIRASGNVSSITDNGTGDYTVNFTTAMADANYSVVGMTKYRDTTGSVGGVYMEITDKVTIANAITTTSVRIGTTATNGTYFDVSVANVAIFR